MIGEVVAGRADIAVENFQNNEQRNKAVDFSHYYLHEPLPLMMKQQKKESMMVS